MVRRYPSRPIVGVGAVIVTSGGEVVLVRRAREPLAGQWSLPGGTLELDYGTLVPMRYMNADQHFKVVSVAAWCQWHALDDSRRFGAALREAIAKSDRTVANVMAEPLEPGASVARRVGRSTPRPKTAAG